MKIILVFIFTVVSSGAFGQAASEHDIKELAEKINQQSKGVELGNGISVRGCLATGRTLVFQYDVPEGWTAPDNIKTEILSNLRTAGTAQTYFKFDINADFYYYIGNSLQKRVIIKSHEFSTFEIKLGDYLSIKDHPKAKGVNLKLKTPKGWEVKEGDRPNIVKKFVRGSNIYIILIKENMTFFSRDESKELLQDQDFAREFVEEVSSTLNNPEVLGQSIVTIDTYPALEFRVNGTMERSGVTIPVILKYWVVLYEDKLIFLQAMSSDPVEFKALEQLYFLITNSVIFPEQFN